MDITCRFSIPICDPGHRATSYSTKQDTNPYKDSAQAPLSPMTSCPESSYPNSLPFQPLHQGVPPGFPRLSPSVAFLRSHLGLCPPYQLSIHSPSQGSPSRGGSSSLTTSKFGLLSPVLRRCLSAAWPTFAPAHPSPPFPLLLPISHPLRPVPGCPRKSTSLPWASHPGVKLPFSITCSAHDQMTSAAEASSSSNPLLRRWVPGRSTPSPSACRPLRWG